MGIKAVAFDYGNVLSLPQDPGTMGLLAAIADIGEEQARDICFNGRVEWDAARIETQAFYRAGFARHGLEPDEGLIAAFSRADLESWASLNEESAALVEAVKAKGLRTAVLSNMPPEFLTTVRRRFPLLAEIDVGIYSCEHKLAKPEPAIYELLISRLGLPAQEILFFDDMRVNVDAAKEAGIAAHLWTGPADARKVLEAAGAV